MAWTDDSRAKAVKMYKNAEPTASNSVEIVQEIAEELGESPNGVRMVLMKADVYIKKDSTSSKSTSTKADGDKPARVNKEDAHNALTSAIEAAGHKADSEIISKLTGKAAVYFTGLFS